MKRVFAKAIAVCLVISIFFGANAITTFAADKFYQTIKDNVKTWSEPNSDSKELLPIPSAGTVVTVTSSTVNSKGKLWYKIGDNRWVYSENVTDHFHNFNNGRCTGWKCKLSEILCISNVDNILYEAVRDGVKLRPSPYEAHEEEKTVSQGTILTVVMEAVNAYDNLWYKTNEGLWVYENNVKRHDHSFVCVNERKEYMQKNESKHTVVSKYDDSCSCEQIFSTGVITEKYDENHSFNANNICTKCGYEKSIVPTTEHNHVESACSITPTIYYKNTNIVVHLDKSLLLY